MEGSTSSQENPLGSLTPEMMAAIQQMIDQKVDEKVKAIQDDLQAKMKQSVAGLIKPGLLGAKREAQSEVVKQRPQTARNNGDDIEEAPVNITNNRPATGVKKIGPGKNSSVAKRSESKDQANKAGEEDKKKTTGDDKKKENERRLEEAKAKREELEKKKKEDAEKKRLMEEERTRKNEEAAAIKKKAAAEAREKSTQPLPQVNALSK